ncbi:MAG TPA: CidA/LrgA family protein [Phycisphaerae bacterium]|nr:CidA/LrgA family protein [Phycisphaerae bacterium]
MMRFSPINRTIENSAPPARSQAPNPHESLPHRPARKAVQLLVNGLLGLLLLLACVLIGEVARRLAHLPLPGPVIGLALLAIILALSSRLRLEQHSARVEPIARLLISHMGLLFVPAGVGIIMEVSVLRAQWLPILAGLLGSTFICLIATAWLMHLHLLGKDEKKSRE